MSNASNTPQGLYDEILERYRLKDASEDNPLLMKANTAFEVFEETGDSAEICALYNTLIGDAAEVADPVMARIEARYPEFFADNYFNRLKDSVAACEAFTDYIVARFIVRSELNKPVSFGHFSEFREEFEYLAENGFLYVNDPHALEDKLDETDCLNENGEPSKIGFLYDIEIEGSPYSIYLYPVSADD